MDEEHNQPQSYESVPFAGLPKPKNTPPWPAIAMGLVLVLTAVGLALLFWRAPQHSVEPSAPPAYAEQIVFTNIKLSTAQNFLGGSVTYIDGTVANSGDKTIIAARVQALFKNSLGEVVQKESLPLTALRTTGAYPEAIDLRVLPLAPHQSSAFRLTLERISADWNRELPELRITSLTTQ